MDSVQNTTYIPSSDEVFQLFKRLNNVPRPSWHEEKVADFLCAFADSLHLDYSRDAHNCVVIRKPATPGYENATPVVVLNHCDMVCVAEKGKAFDPLNDAIVSYEDNGWLKARGTSLGADNGIGLCMALAVLQDDSIVHGPLEVIATTNEEDGMTGAANLAPDFIKGRKVINLDSEDYDTITVGSAGAYLQFTTLPFTLQPVPEDYTFFRLNINGGLGGHSGVDINKGRANANKIICSILDDLNNMLGVVLSEINGGEANNSIAVNAEAVVGVKSSQKELFVQCVDSYFCAIKSEYMTTDGALAFQLAETAAPAQIITKKTTDALLRSVNVMPYGALKMSDTLPNTVETSNNTGMVKTKENEFFISNYSRSFIDADVVRLGQEIKDIFDGIGATTIVIMSAPAWQSDPSSQFIRMTEQIFQQLLGFRPSRIAMHFALEAGYFVQKYPDIEIVSIGPKIIEPHSITERVDISTIDNIWKVFIELLSQLTVNN